MTQDEVNKVRQLYDWAKEDGYDVGEYDTWVEEMRLEDGRRAIYDNLSKDENYDLGTWEHFSDEMNKGLGSMQAPVQPQTTIKPKEGQAPSDAVRAEYADTIMSDGEIVPGEKMETTQPDEAYNERMRGYQAGAEIGAKAASTTVANAKKNAPKEQPLQTAEPTQVQPQAQEETPQAPQSAQEAQTNYEPSGTPWLKEEEPKPWENTPWNTRNVGDNKAVNEEWKAARQEQTATTQQLISGTSSADAWKQNATAMRRMDAAEYERKVRGEEFDNTDNNFETFYQTSVAPTFKTEREKADAEGNRAAAQYPSVTDSNGMTVPNVMAAAAYEKATDPAVVTQNVIANLDGNALSQYVERRMHVDEQPMMGGIERQLTEEELNLVRDLIAAENGDVVTKLQQRMYQDYINEGGNMTTAGYILGNGFRNSLLMRLQDAIVTRIAGSSGLRKQFLDMAYQRAGERAGAIARGVSGAVTMIADAPAFGVAGKVAAPIAKGVIGAAGKAIAGRAAGELGAAAAERFIVANSALGRTATAMAQSGLTFSGYDVMSEGVNQLQEGRFDAGKLVGSAVKGFKTGAAVGALGGVVGEVTKNLTGAARVATNIGGFAAEVGLFTGMQGLEMANALGVPISEVDWGALTIENAAMLGVLKLQSMPQRAQQAASLDMKLNTNDIESLRRLGYDFGSIPQGLKSLKTINSGDKVTARTSNQSNEKEVREMYLKALLDPDLPLNTKRKLRWYLEGEYTVPERVFGYKVEENDYDDVSVFFTTYAADGSVIDVVRVQGADLARLEGKTQREMDFNRLDVYNRMLRSEHTNNGIRLRGKAFAEENGLDADFMDELLREYVEEGKMPQTESERVILDNFFAYEDNEGIRYGARMMESVNAAVWDETGIDVLSTIKRTKGEDWNEEELNALHILTERLDFAIRSNEELKQNIRQGRIEANDVDLGIQGDEPATPQDGGGVPPETVEQAGAEYNNALQNLLALDGGIEMRNRIDGLLNVENSIDEEFVSEFIGSYGALGDELYNACMDYAKAEAKRRAVEAKAQQAADDIQKGYGETFEPAVNEDGRLTMGVYDGQSVVIKNWDNESDLVKILDARENETTVRKADIENINLGMPFDEWVRMNTAGRVQTIFNNVNIAYQPQESVGGDGGVASQEVNGEGGAKPAEDGGPSVTPDGEIPPTGDNSPTPPTEPENIAPTEPQQPRTEGGMPLYEEGGKMKPDFKNATSEETYNYLYGERKLNRDDINAFVRNKVADAEKRLNKLEGKRPKMGTDLDEFEEKVSQWEKDKADTQKELDYWNDVQRRAKQENLDEQRENADLAAQWKKVAALDDAVSLHEYLMRQVYGGLKFIWENNENGTKGLGAHLGLGDGAEKRSRRWMIGKQENGAMYPEQAAEMIAERYNADTGQEVSYDDVFNTLLDILRGYDRKSVLGNDILKEHNAGQFNEDTFNKEDEKRSKDAWAVEHGFTDFDSAEDYMKSLEGTEQPQEEEKNGLDGLDGLDLNEPTDLEKPQEPQAKEEPTTPTEPAAQPQGTVANEPKEKVKEPIQPATPTISKEGWNGYNVGDTFDWQLEDGTKEKVQIVAFDRSNSQDGTPEIVLRHYDEQGNLTGTEAYPPLAFDEEVKRQKELQKPQEPAGTFNPIEEAKKNVEEKEKKGTGKTSANGEKKEKKKDEPKSKWVNDEDADEFEEIRRKLREKLNQLNSGFDPEALQLSIRMAYLLMKHGVRKFADFAKQVIDAIGDGVRPHLKSIYAAAYYDPRFKEFRSEMTPLSEMEAFDVDNFDKKPKEETNGREKSEQQIAADTEAVASQAATVASEVESKLQAAGSEKELNALGSKVDDALDKVNEQLAVLGYYRADEVDSDFNEAYGYMRNAEKKAVKNITDLSKTIVKELGITDPTVYDYNGKKAKNVRANIAPIGGDVTMRLSLDQEKGIELSMDFLLDSDVENNRDNLSLRSIMYRVEQPKSSGSDQYLTSNYYFDTNVSLDDMISELKRVCKDWLPSEPIASENEVEAIKKIAKTPKKKKKIVSSQQNIPDLFSGLFNEEKIDNDNDTKGIGQTEGNSGEPGRVGGVSSDGNGVLDTDGTGRTDGGGTSKVSDGTEPVANGEREELSSERGEGVVESGHNGNDKEQGGLSDSGRGNGNGDVENGRDDNRGTTSTIRAVQTGGSRPSGAKGTGLAQPGGRRPVKPTKELEPKFQRNYIYPENSSEIDNMPPQQRLTSNVEALEVLRSLMKENRDATPEEREILGRYRGWGGVDLGQSYSTNALRNGTSGKWGIPTEKDKLLRRLADLIDELDPNGERGILNAINRAKLTSYYTPTAIAKDINRFFEAAGFKGGSMMDPSMGNGVFEGTMPKDVQQRTMINGIELDWLTGQIARRLYPDANVLVTGFEQADTPENAYDIVVSNIPFGDIRITDKSWNHNSSPVRKAAQNKIHNYFAVKMLDSTRPGGLCVIMTSNAILDTKGNQIIREYLADQAEILGVVRLPDNTFKGAGTKVVTDVIYLRKYKDDIDRTDKRTDETYLESIERPFLSSDVMELVNPTDERTYKVAMNGYFTKNREMMIGEPKAGGQYRKDEFGLSSTLDTDGLAQSMRELIDKHIVGDRKGKLFDTHKTEREVKQAVSEAYKGDGQYISNGNIVEQDGKFGVVSNVKSKYGDATRMFTELPAMKSKADRLRIMFPLRKAMKELISSEIDGEGEERLKELRKNLQTAYDNFVKKYGRLNSKDNDFLTSDIDGYTIRSLEKWKEGQFEGLSDIFTKNTIKPALDLTKAKTPTDAIGLSLAEYGEIKPSFMEEILGESWVEQCGDVIFKLPYTEDTYVTADGYLSGDVKTKLAQAQKAAKYNKEFERNVKALEAVQPKDIPFDEISIRMGARWVPDEVYSDFLYDMFGINKDSYRGTKSGVVYLPEADTYVLNVNEKELGGDAEKWATPRKKPQDIFAAALQDKALKVYDKGDYDKPVINKEQTELANDKVQELRSAFEDWLSSNPEREEKLLRIYNDKFNRTVLRKWDGSHLNVPGLSGKELRPHQKDAVWMLINNRGGIVDHIVGAGKTLVMQSTIMEMRRMGIAKKPMIIALKVTVAQIAKDFREAYPAARILAPTEKDFEKENRKKLLAKIALNDYDCVILSHDNYKGLAHTEEVERMVIDEQMAQLDAALEYLYGTGDKSQLTKKQIKGLETRKANLEARLAKVLDRKIDREFTFEGLGVDYLFVDECQEFKSLPYVSTYDRVAGLGSKEGSQKAVALLNGVRYLQKLHQGDRGTIFLSGTTISNSLSEIYNLLNYLRPSELQRLGMTTFDAWAGNFAVHTSELEYGVTNELKEKDRFRSLTNIPELSKMYTEIADVRNDYNLKLDKPKMRSHIVPVPQSDVMKEINEAIIQMVKFRSGTYFGFTGNDKTPWGLRASDLSAKVAINPRLIDDTLEDEGGKIPAVCENVKKIYDKFAEQKGTQLIFCDTGVPGKGKKYDAYTDIINRLVNDYGIPREEIVDIHTANTNEKRKALFAKVNDGSVRILLGGTQNMGTGVNVQKRIVAMHHVDVPWTPADREQREGRGVRQGNEIARDFNDNNVDVYFYATEGSLDMYKYQLQETKGKLFAQFKSGAVGERTFDEGDAEGDFDPAEIVATLSGNPVIFEKSKQDKKVEKLRRAKRAYESDWQRRKANFDYWKNRKRNLERLASGNADDVKRLERKGFVANEEGKYPNDVTVQVKDEYSTRRTFDKPKEAGEYILELLSKGKKVQLSGFGHDADITKQVDEYGMFAPPEATLNAWSGIKYVQTVSDDAVVAGQTFRVLLSKVYRWKEIYKESLAEAEEKLKGADPGENKFPKQAELDEAIEVKKRLDEEYKKLSDDGNEENTDTDSGVRMRLVEDKAEIDRLEAEPKSEGYRNVVLNDDLSLGSPMAGKLGKKGTGRKATSTFNFNKWERSDEHPELATDDGKIDLIKPKGKGEVGGVDYNPYIHIRPTLVNKQFKQAWERPDLVYVKTLYPTSELESGYHAEKAKLSVGKHPWNGGELILSRWDKPVEIMRWDKVADDWAEEFRDRGAEFDIVPPGLLPYLVERGIEILPPHKGMGAACNKAYEAFKRGEYNPESISNERIDELNKRIEYGGRTDTDQKQSAVEQLAAKLGVKVNIVDDVNAITHGDARQQERRRNANGWYNTATGEVTIVLPNNRNVDDVIATTLHEVVAHKGLREMVGEERYNEFLDEIYSHLNDELKEKVDKMAFDMFMNGLGKSKDTTQEHRRVAVDELLGKLAEKGFEDFTEGEKSIWQRLKEAVLKVLNKFLDTLKLPKWFTLGDNELRYILWRSKERMERGKESPIDMAKDNIKRRELKLNDGDLYSSTETDDIWNDNSLSMSEKIASVKVRLAQNQSDNKTLRNEALQQLGTSLSDLRKAMRLQRDFDQSTVKRVSDLARIMMKGGYLRGLETSDFDSILAAVKNSVGHDNVEGAVQRLMDIMIDNQLKNAEKVLKALETIKGKKVNESGVEVIGELDPRGQRMMEVFKKVRRWKPEDIEDAIDNAIDRMGSDDNAVAEEAANEYAGLMLAQNYVDTIIASEVEEAELRKEIKEAHDNASESDRRTPAYRDLIRSLNDAIRENKIERAEAYIDLAQRMSVDLKQSIENAKDFKEAEKMRVNEIHHNANSDMEGRPAKEHYQSTVLDALANFDGARFFLAPLNTFFEMLRMFGYKSANGEGYTFNRFGRGWVDARNKEIKGVRSKFKIIDNKITDIFGGKIKSAAELIWKDKKFPMGSVTIKNGGTDETFKMTQLQLLYIYMTNKMLDGDMKLRKMGISESDVERIADFLDPKLLEFADWIQREFLVNCRNEYNQTHKRVFGASMAAIEDYFPLNILKNAIDVKAEDLDRPKYNNVISVIVGPIIKRNRNTKPLDILHSNAISLLLEHVATMEHWNAFCEFNRDLNTLRTYKRFRVQLSNMATVYGSGDELLKNFDAVCQIAVGAYHPDREGIDRTAVNLAKGYTASAIVGRMFTAYKQLESILAYIPYVRADKMFANLVNPKKAWDWTLENLPILEERWRSRIAGDPRLLKTEVDWKMWRTKTAEIAQRLGMTPNAFMDMVSVAIGAHAIYQTRYPQYIKDGYSAEEANHRALQDSAIIPNETQQSSESAFLSPMQVSKTWINVLFTIFRNASMGYQRRLHNSLRNFKHNLVTVGKEKSIEFMKKQFVRDGMDEDVAEANARRKFNRQLFRDFLSLATFGCIVQMGWNLMPYLPYMLAGNDEEEKDKMWQDVMAHTAGAAVEGLTGGDVISEVVRQIVTKEGLGGKVLGNLEKEMPVTQALKEAWKDYSQDKGAETLNDIVNIVVATSIGVNPQNITDAVVAIMDACGDDPALAHEAAIFAFRVLQVPQSQIDKLYFDEVGLSDEEASKYSMEELAERYARYKVKRGHFFAPWSWDDKEALGKAKKKAQKAIKERVDRLGGKEQNDKYAEYEEKYKAIADEVKAAKEVGEKNKKKGDAMLDALYNDKEKKGLYDTFKKLDKGLDDLAKRYLKAINENEAELYHNAIEEYKQLAVKVLESPDSISREKNEKELKALLDRVFKEMKEIEE